MRKSGQQRALLLSTTFLALTGSSFAADDYFEGVTKNLVAKPIVSGDGSTVALTTSANGPNAGAIWSSSGLVDIPSIDYVFAISRDGTVVAGNQGGGVAWTAAGAVRLKLLGGRVFANALTMSADGSTIVGWSFLNNAYDNDKRHAVIWDPLTGNVTDLGSLVENDDVDDGWAEAVSGDGKVVVGFDKLTEDYFDHEARIFRWESGTGMVDIGGVAEHGVGILVSEDGLVITSKSATPDGHFRWVGDETGSAGYVDYMAGDAAASAVVVALSADGNTVVGNYRATGATADHAFRWLNGVGTDLGTLGGTTSMVNDVSADGSMAVGYATDAAETRQAVRWAADSRTGSIAELLTEGGVDIAGWTLDEATSISDNGEIIVGTGSVSDTPGFWITRCTTICSAIVSPEIIGQSFSGLGALGATASTYLGTELTTAGDMVGAGKDGTVTGFAYGAFDSDPTTSATIGASYDLGNDLTIVGSLGIAGIETMLPYDGTASFSGPTATLAIASKPDTGFNWLVGGSLIGLNGTIERGYLNGATPVTSSGNTSGTGAALTAELGWTFADLIADTLVTPFVSVSVATVSYAGYTETGGPFPATFAPFTTTSALLRLGTEFRHEFATGSYVTAGLSYGHNFGNGGTISGSSAGFSPSVPGAAPIADFVEASVGLDLPLTDTVNFSGRIAAIIPFGAPASIQARAGITMSF